MSSAHESCSSQAEMPLFAVESLDTKRGGWRSSGEVPNLARAAMVGLLFGLACDDKPKPKPTEQPAEKSAATSGSAGETEKDKACCMGLNECKGQGGCAVPESNECAGKNECKGKGGCNMHCPKK